MLELFVAGLILGLTHAIPPGPITFEVLRRAVTSGPVDAIKTDIGAVAADAIYFILIMIGLAQVVNNPTGRVVLWLIGCMVLLGLGLKGLHGALCGKANNSQGKQSRGESSSIVSGFLISITSPFTIIWWTGIFAGIASTVTINLESSVLAFLGIELACILWFTGLAAIGSASKKFIGEKYMTAMSAVCALVMIAFGVLLFYQGYTTIL
ncbi:LysE family translocator [Methanocella arvoryzae]|uniref:Lysine exporter (LysE family) n=1 Tax=Methanocella arvoryzae (strain DSM 22066 / NBRC 105507 / MRE50) TaxID=351160 RepID=Q0W139_METAR|nr:LysE family transporter [Methanocella arvoryzae]CAJ37904.1 putative lysine exporter (LysE family) [Methanocella arvoryzae MRE50]